MQLGNQPEGDHQEDVQTYKGNDRVKQWCTHQASTQVQLLEEGWQNQAADSSNQQCETETQTNGDTEQQRAEEQPCQQAYRNACQDPTESAQAQFSEDAAPEITAPGGTQLPACYAKRL